MGTYLQGVQSIIPSIQPHDTGLNMVANLLQLKQSQYDSNYKQLNKMYGQFYYADLTRDDNIKRRDATVQQIDLDLKRIAGLDLSLDQNVQQASQVFKPFYEDGALMKDMAWTKNFNNTLGAAEGLLKSDDEKARKQYWDEGIRELQYRREEFKNAAPEEAMGFGDPVYTSYVNVGEKTRELAKKAGLSYEKTSMSPDGKWIMKNKNGQLIIEPLSSLFEAELGRDPAVQAVYKTQAYVNRKDFAKGEADKYGGEAQAEMEYMKDAYGKMKKLTENRHADKQANSKAYDARIADIQAQIKQNGSDPILERDLEQYQEAKKVNDEILGKLDEQLNQFNNSYSSSGNTSTGEFKNPYKDVNQLRNVVDGNMANMLMNEDLMSAATRLAYTDAKEDFKENPYAVLDVKHAHQLSEINAAGSWRYQTEQLKGANRLKAIEAEAYYDEFSYSGAPKEGKSSGSGKGSGSGKTVSEDAYLEALGTASNLAAPAEKQKEAAATIKKYEEQTKKVNDAFEVVEVTEGGAKDKSNKAVEESKILQDKYDKYGKAGVLKLLKTYEQAYKDKQLTKEEFFRLVAPKGEAMIPENMINHPAYSGKEYTEPQKLFTDPSYLVSKVEKEGPDFLLKYTNREKAWKTKDLKSSGGKYTQQELIQMQKKSKLEDDNYTMSLMKKGTNWVYKNPNIGSVKVARLQGLDTDLANSFIFSRNMQDFRNWRHETKDAIVDDMYSSLSKDPKIIREFGTAKFDKNGKYLKTDMSRFKEELNNMFDESGKLNPNYKLKTNYEISFDQERYARAQNQQGAFNFGTPDFDVSQLRPEQQPGQVIAKPIYLSGTSGPETGYEYQGPKSYSEAITDINKTIMSQFVSSASNIYTDSDDRHVLGNMKIPFTKSATDNPNAIAGKGLKTNVDLSDPSSLGAISFFQFGKDWSNMKDAINGVDRFVSFEGASVAGLNSATAEEAGDFEKSTSNIGKNLLDKYFEWARKNDTEANSFSMIGQNLAAENTDLGAMKIMLPEKFLKEHLIDKEKNPNGMLDETSYENLTKYGLTVIAPNKDFNNMLHNSMTTPLQAHVNYNNSYTWNHPSGTGSFTIRKGGEGEGDYVTEKVLKDYYGQQVGSTGVVNSILYGENLEFALENGVNELNDWTNNTLKKYSQQSKNIQMKPVAPAPAPQPVAPQPEEKPFSLGQPD